MRGYGRRVLIYLAIRVPPELWKTLAPHLAPGEDLQHSRLSRLTRSLPLDLLTISVSDIYSRCMSKSGPMVPLTPAVFHILLALFGKERHGYDIMQQVKADSQDAVKMGPGTLYGSLDRMIEAGLVAKSNTRDPRRIYYKLTPFGQATFRAETERLSRLAVVARRQLGTA
jgi:DNA-binding MarR family transcriptional regulator